jgi:hypothetical protein
MTYVTWAGQNSTDRQIGEEWEVHFTEMVTDLGMDCHRPDPPEVWWKKGLLPDRVVRAGASLEWHEIKHKRPTRNGEYGIEDYRFEANVNLGSHTGNPVLYTIHDWELSGAESRDEPTENHLEDWLTIDFQALAASPRREGPGMTYRNSSRAETTIYYWSAGLWEPLAWRWGIDAANKSNQRDEAGYLRDASWEAIKNAREWERTGHGTFVRWARSYLGLDDR